LVPFDNGIKVFRILGRDYVSMPDRCLCWTFGAGSAFCKARLGEPLTGIASVTL